MVDLPVRGVLNKFTNEEQDPAVVEQVQSRVSQILTPGEEILHRS
jgi:hypothetical protein